MQLDLCAFGVTKNQKAGIVLENYTPEPDPAMSFIVL